MASANEKVSAVEEKIAELSVNAGVEPPASKEQQNVFEPHLSGFEMPELYKIALNFYKGKGTGFTCTHFDRCLVTCPRIFRAFLLFYRSMLINYLQLHSSDQYRSDPCL
jgi:hypothetical protein